MIVAKGVKARVELEGNTIRIIETGVFGDKNAHEIKISSVMDVELKEEGLTVGYIHFSVPGYKEHGGVFNSPRDNTVTFRKPERAAFQRVYDAVAGPIHGARATGSTLARLLTPGLQPPTVSPATPGTETHGDLRLGEVMRQFDSQTAGVVEGTLRHELGLHGALLAVGSGGFGFGVGSFGLSGATSVDLHTQSTTRTDLLNEGFVAVFDAPTPSGIPDTLRLVVPSQAACRDMLVGFIRAIDAQEGSVGLSSGQVERMISVASSVVVTEASYVADRLAAVLRVNPTPAPVFSVVGVPAAAHTLLGGAIQFPGEDRWLQLSPIGLFRLIGPSGQHLIGS